MIPTCVQSFQRCSAEIWAGFGSDARLTIPDVDIFNEWGGQYRLTAAEATLYIEVIP